MEIKENFKVTAIETGKEYWISRSVAVAVIIYGKDLSGKDENVFLIHKRGPGCPDNIGKWSVNCGYINWGETIKQAAIRETFEETGLKLNESLSYYIEPEDGCNLTLTIDANIQKFLEKFNKCLLTYNIGYVFLTENIDQNLEALKNYMKETVLDVETHRYGRFKKFFTAFVLIDDLVYNPCIFFRFYGCFCGVNNFFKFVYHCCIENVSHTIECAC